MPDTAVIHPKFHHVNLKTTRLQVLVEHSAAVPAAAEPVVGRPR